MNVYIYLPILIISYYCLLVNQKLHYFKMLLPLGFFVSLAVFSANAQESLSININNWTAILSGEWMVEL